MRRSALPFVRVGAPGSAGLRQRRYPRLYATHPSSSQPNSPSPWLPRIGTMFTILTLGAVVVTSVGLWQYSQEFKTWPSFIRGDLRQAVLQAQRGEDEKALGYWHRAWQTARERKGELGDDATIKLSGIAIELGGLLEKMGKDGQAYPIYRQALEDVLHQSGEITDEAMERAISLAQRCGDLAIRLGRFEEAERWMTWSVREILRTQGATSQAAGSSLEALGNLYQTLGHGKERLALPCFLQALAVLVPDLAGKLPKGEELTNLASGGKGSTPPSLDPPQVAPDLLSSSSDLCHAATVCCNISQILTLTPTDSNLACAEEWTRYGIALAERPALSTSATQQEPCTALPVLYFNLGMTTEMQAGKGKLDQSRDAYRTAREIAKRQGFIQGIGEADRALARLQ